MISKLEGAWELLSGQPLPDGARDIKIFSRGHFMFIAYEAQSGKPLYAAGGVYTLNDNVYVEHLEYASDKLAELIGKEQSFDLQMDGDTLIQRGVLSNGKPLSEKFKRLS